MFMGRTDVEAETPIFWPADVMLGKIEFRRRRGHQRMRCLDGINSIEMGFGGLQELVMDSDMLQFMGSQRVRHN